ncbi:DMT family transporter [Morganella morganii]|uniref:DMT family transporter n=1 Tax=Morganella morganii TaxID=582 RepID=UPI0021147842|nr:DMT family transporter [Morganella morganii]
MTMKKEILLPLIALLSGVLLTLMIMSNSYLSTFTSPLHASWLTHGTGAVVALIIWLTVKTHLPQRRAGKKNSVVVLSRRNTRCIHRIAGGSHC